MTAEQAVVPGWLTRLREIMSGEVCFEMADWVESRRSGFKVVFHLPGASDLAPLRAVTERDAGRVGQRFRLFFTDFEQREPLFACDALLAGWQEAPRRRTAAFWLASSQDLERFKLATPRDKDCHGSLWHVYLVEMDPAETPVPVKGGPLARNAGRFCADSQYLDYLRAQGLEPDAERARQYLLDYCQIDSRRLLDHDPAAAARYRQIKRAVMDWAGGIDAAG